MRRFSPGRPYLLLTDREDYDIIEGEERLEWKRSAATDKEREKKGEKKAVKEERTYLTSSQVKNSRLIEERILKMYPEAKNFRYCIEYEERFYKVLPIVECHFEAENCVYKAYEERSNSFFVIDYVKEKEEEEKGLED